MKNKETGIWFLEWLIDDLVGSGFCSRCTFVSDQQKASKCQPFIHYIQQKDVHLSLIL